MNDKLKDYINSIGALVETWDMVYKIFKSRGYSDDAALSHTSLFMRTFINSAMDFNNNKEDI